MTTGSSLVLKDIMVIFTSAYREFPSTGINCHWFKNHPIVDAVILLPCGEVNGPVTSSSSLTSFHSDEQQKSTLILRNVELGQSWFGSGSVLCSGLLEK